MTRADRIRSLLNEALQPSHLDVIDESSRHAGHQPGFDGAGGTHLRVVISAESLSPLSRVERHRRINAILAPEFETGLHALAIEVK